MSTRSWLDRPLGPDDLDVPECDRERWADALGAVTVARMRLTWPEPQMRHWCTSGALLVVPASGGVIPGWTLAPLPAMPGSDGPYIPHPLVALVSTTVRPALCPRGGATEDRSRALLDWWHAPHPLAGGEASPRDLLDVAPPQLLLYAAWHSGGYTRWLPQALRDL